MKKLCLPDDAPAGVELWCERLALNAEPAASDWGLLDAVEFRRACRYQRCADRVRAVRGRAQLRRLLAARLGTTPQALYLRYGVYGKPELAQQLQGLQFNVAHGGLLLLIALAPAGVAIGVDVEATSNASAAAESVSLLLSADEQGRMQSTLSPLRRWVAKEAVLKALGVGIAEHMNALSVYQGALRNRYELGFDPGKTWPLSSQQLTSLRAWRLPLHEIGHGDDHEAVLCCLPKAPQKEGMMA